jgi:hypothetical protein
VHSISRGAILSGAWYGVCSTAPSGRSCVLRGLLYNGASLPPPHPFLAEILRKFRVHLHQLTPNAIVQISKFLWAIISCRGHPTTGVFMMYYELHYQQYKIKLGGSENKLAAQFGCITFHPSRFRGKVKLTSAVRNKWPSRWVRN